MMNKFEILFLVILTGFLFSCRQRVEGRSDLNSQSSQAAALVCADQLTIVEKADSQQICEDNASALFHPGVLGTGTHVSIGFVPEEKWIAKAPKDEWVQFDGSLIGVSEPSFMQVLGRTVKLDAVPVPNGNSEFLMAIPIDYQIKEPIGDVAVAFVQADKKSGIIYRTISIDENSGVARFFTSSMGEYQLIHIRPAIDSEKESVIFDDAKSPWLR